MQSRDILQFARATFDRQSFSQLIGAELKDLSDMRAVVEVVLRSELRQQHGYAHGGVLSYLADNAITFAGGVALSGDALTAEFKINYVTPASGPLLRAIAEPVSVSGRQAVCQCRIISLADDEETLVALAQGTVARLPSNHQRTMRASDQGDLTGATPPD
ncbi:PaaI family thioesterase [Salipiger mucosus]|uniref:PaaI family thioesterase n=1 Tax=Salipiger mucosus TaxID=263378 RepID=UPI000A0127F6|nr:PaaI family thioesterase [Salipiger mucosus]